MQTPDALPPSPASLPPSPASLLRRVAAGLGWVLIGLIHLLPFALALLCAFWGTRFAMNAWHLSLWLALPFGLGVGMLFLGLIAQGANACQKLRRGRMDT